jgi:hypothetical protein
LAKESNIGAVAVLYIGVEIQQLYCSKFQFSDTNFLGCISEANLLFEAEFDDTVSL